MATQLDGGYINNSYLPGQDNTLLTLQRPGLGDYISNLGSSLFNVLQTPFGTGDNATTLGQLGLTGLLGGYSIFNSNRQFEDQLKEARRQFEFSKGLSQANFMNQGTNFLNQSLFQLEGLNAFNPNAGAERASNLNAAVNQLNSAASKIGLGNNAFQDQQNAISKYNQLVGA